MGSLFKPKYPPAGMSYKHASAAGLLKESAVFWIKYRANGRPVRESSESEKESVAKSLLKRREGAAEEGRAIIPRADRVTIGELLDELKQEYEANARKSVERLGFSLARLRPFFGHYRATRLTSADVTRYRIAQRKEAGAAERDDQPGARHPRPHVRARPEEPRALARADRREAPTSTTSAGGSSSASSPRPCGRSCPSRSARRHVRPPRGGGPLRGPPAHRGARSTSGPARCAWSPARRRTTTADVPA